MILSQRIRPWWRDVLVAAAAASWLTILNVVFWSSDAVWLVLAVLWAVTIGYAVYRLTRRDASGPARLRDR